MAEDLPKGREAPPETESREGFFLGYGMGVGGENLGGGTFRRNDTVLAYFFNLQAGGGLSDRLLLLGEVFGTLGATGFDPNFTLFLFATQYYLTDYLYVRPGVGIGMAVEQPETTTPGFAANIAAGLEWKFERAFAFSPEARLNFVRTGGSNNYLPGFLLYLRYYF